MTSRRARRLAVLAPAIVVLLVLGTTFAVAATLALSMNLGDNAHVTCPTNGKLSKTTNKRYDWTVRCRLASTTTTSPTSTAPTSTAPTSTAPTSTAPTSTAPTSTAPTSSSTSTAGTWLCTTSNYQGRCGVAWSDTSFCGYPGIVGIVGGTNGGCPYVDQNVWGAITGETQTLNANSPGDWQIINKTPVNSSGSVTTFPNVGAPFSETPMSSFASITSTFDETMPHNSATSGWAMYDNWFDDWKYEVMIQHDFTRNGPCTYAAVATFNSQLWGLCTFGNINGGAYAWKLAAPGSTAGSSGTANESTGTIDIKAMTQWLVDHGYMAANPTVTNLSYGWEIASTGGTAETFQVNNYTLVAQ